MKAALFIGLLIGISGIPSVVKILDTVLAAPPLEREMGQSVSRSSLSQTVTNSNPDDSTKVAIISLRLHGMTKKDHAVTKDEFVYVSVSREIFARLPKSVNGLKIKRYTGSTMPNENDFSYLNFSQWEQKNDSVWVTSTAYFAGGNIGGCNEQYDRSKGGKWTRVKSECFAMAS